MSTLLWSGNGEKTRTLVWFITCIGTWQHVIKKKQCFPRGGKKRAFSCPNVHKLVSGMRTCLHSVRAEHLIVPKNGAICATEYPTEYGVKFSVQSLTVGRGANKGES